MIRTNILRQRGPKKEAARGKTKRQDRPPATDDERHDEYEMHRPTGTAGQENRTAHAGGNAYIRDMGMKLEGRD